MTQHDAQMKEILTGVLIGATIGAVAAYFIAQQGKSHHDLDDDLDNLQDENGFFEDEEESPLWLEGIAGVLLAGVASLLLAPSYGNLLREHISEAYENVNAHTWKLINSLQFKGNMIGDMLGKQTAEWNDKALELTDTLTEEVRTWAEALRDAAEQAKVKAAEMDKTPHYRQKISEVLEWSQKAIELADTVSEEVKEWSDDIAEVAEELQSSEKRRHSDAHPQHDVVGEVIEWATLGVNLWQAIKQKKH